MKSWISNEKQRSINNVLIDSKKCANPCLPKDSSFHKNNPINRHCSEEDFKKYFNQPASNPYQEKKKVAETVATGMNYKFVKPYHKNSQKSSKLFEKVSSKEKNGVNFYKKQKTLKQTSSTQSQDSLKIPRPIPSFMMNRPSEYYYMRLSSPRIGLKRDNFKIYSKLGEGKFGKVFMVKEVSTGFVLAMKIVEKAKIVKQNLLDQFIRELKIQLFLNHPNIISLYGFFQDETHFYILMELGCDRQLYSLIEHHKVLSQETTSFIVTNLLEAITYIHDNRVLHRDIKPENIVLIMGNVKMCDFGWAVNKMHPSQLRITFCGTPLYLSPEILEGNWYDEKVDLWAIGVLAYELRFGCSPFNISDQADLQAIINQEVDFDEKEISEEFKEFIKAMLTKNPKQRLNSRQLLQLQFITKYEGFETCQELCR